MSKWVALSIAALVGLALLLRANAGRLSGFGEAEIVALVATGGLLLFVGLSALSDYRGRMGEAFRDLFAWLAIAVALVVVYAFRDDFTAIAHRVAGEILPPGQVVALGQDNEAGERAVRIRRRGDGHFAARTDVDGTAISMLVDTGASSLVLRSADAEAIAPLFTDEGYPEELDRRFGAMINFGKTAGYRDLHMGHRVVDELVETAGPHLWVFVGDARIPRSRRWRTTGLGRRLMATAIQVRQINFPQLLALAA